MHALRSTAALAALLLGVIACTVSGAPRPADTDAAADERAVTALAESVLVAARARDAERFASYFAPGDELVYLLNTTSRLSSQAALRDAFRRVLGRQQSFDPQWTDRRVQILSPGAAVFTGAFGTAARDTSGARWAVRGVVTFAARRGAAGWRIVNWHTSETAVAP